MERSSVNKPVLRHLSSLKKLKAMCQETRFGITRSSQRITNRRKQARRRYALCQKLVRKACVSSLNARMPEELNIYRNTSNSLHAINRSEFSTREDVTTTLRREISLKRLRPIKPYRTVLSFGSISVVRV